ncbi:MAG: BTAD domain-containing putative transcriptional regulator [Anaerolineae bacterium]
MGKPLIVTKCLVPGRRSGLLRRPRLIDFLHEHIDRKLVLVCAPAGYGKTSLLIEFAHDADVPVCWYSIDRADGDLRVFAEYLLGALRQRFPDFGQQTLDYLSKTEHLGDAEALVGVLVNEIHQTIPDYFVLVLDDYNLVNPSEAINIFMDSLLQRLPDNTHLIIASRTIPTLTPRGLALMTANQQVAGLGVRELRFTPQEVQDLVRQTHGQEIADDVAQDLARQSEGWVTGILLSTQATWRDLLAGVARTRGLGSGVYDYLANEVFALQPPRVQQFLLGSSVLAEMSAPACNRLLGISDAAETLQYLEDGNVFIVRFDRDDEHRYRYHALFHGFLRQKLAADAPEWQAELHRRAAAMLEEEGDWEAALSHHQATGDSAGVVRVISATAEEMYESGRHETLARWIDGLSEDTLAEQPRLLWYRGRVHAEAGEFSQALEAYQRAFAGLKQAAENEAAARVLVDRAVALRLSGQIPEAASSCREALALLEGQQSPAQEPLAAAYRNLGICLCQMGEMADGTGHLRRALGLYQRTGSRYGLALTHGDLSVALSLAGNQAASEWHNQEALSHWLEIGHPGNIANALNSQGVSQHMRGEYEAALATYERALDYARRGASRRLQAFIWAGKGDVYREMSCWLLAMQAYDEAQPLAEGLRDPSLLTYLRIMKAEVYRGLGEYPQALAHARRAYEEASEQAMSQEAARAAMTLGAIFLEQGDAALARDYVQRAAEVFARSQSRRELALACWHEARIADAQGDRTNALAALRRMAQVTMELGYDHFMVQEVGRALPLLAAAVMEGIGGQMLAELERRTREKTAAVAVVQETPYRPHIRIRALGDCFVEVDGRPVTAADWGRAKSKELFFYLLAYPARNKEQIGAVLWPDLPPARMRSAFHVTLYGVRRALGIADCVLYHNEQYMFNRQLDHWIDVEEFEELVSQAEQCRLSRPSEAEAAFSRAVDVYGGEYLGNMSFAQEEWCFWRRDELQRRFQSALQALGDLRVGRGDYDGALTAYRRLLACDELREDIHRAVMRCLADMGDPNGAMRQYRTLVALLKESLGVAPLPETTRLFQTIVASRNGRSR